MTADIDTKWLIEHMDKRFNDADALRHTGFNAIHTRLDTVSQRVAEHAVKIKAIEERETAATTKNEGRFLTAAKILLSGGSIAAIIEILRRKGEAS